MIAETCISDHERVAIDDRSPDRILMEREEPDPAPLNERHQRVAIYAFQMSNETCQEHADALGISKQAFNKDVQILLDALNLPRARQRYREEKAAAHLAAHDGVGVHTTRGVNQEGEE